MTWWQRFLCNVMGWHRCEAEWHDWCSAVGWCDRCGCRCLQDSNGDWFRASMQEPRCLAAKGRLVGADTLRSAAAKVRQAFMDDGSEFNIPGYIIRELDDAISAYDAAKTEQEPRDE